MNDTLTNLQAQLPEKNVRIIRLVAAAAGELGIPVFIVGATARDIILHYIYKVNIYKETRDVDFGIAVENWTQYERLKQSLIETGGFRLDKKAAHRLWLGRGADEISIDIVPYGKLESPKGQIAFPPDGDFVMNTNGFAEAFQDSLLINLADDLEIRVVSLAGLAVLKFIAYDDNPQKRKKDLQDISFLMKNYLAAGNENRLYEDEDLLNDENFDYQTAGARLLGRDMAKLLTAQTEKIIFKHLSEGADGDGLAKIAETIKISERRLDDNFDEIAEMLRQLKQGLVEKSAK